MQVLTNEDVAMVSGGEVGAVGSGSDLLYTGTVLTPYQACLVDGVNSGGLGRMVMCAIKTYM